MRTARIVVLSSVLLAAFGCARDEQNQFTEEELSQVEHSDMRQLDLSKNSADDWDYIAEKIAEEERIKEEQREKEEEERRAEEQAENEKNNQSDPPPTPTKVELVAANGEIKIPKQFFNEIVNVNGVDTIQNPANILVLANKQFSLPADYRPTDLIQPNVPFVFQGAEQNYLRKEASYALELMFKAAKQDGVQLVARSGFRSYQTQDYLFKREVEQAGYEKAVLAVAKPGTSEHQTGLTMDITANSVNQQLVEEFGETKEGKWLRNNAHRFGFILRYPKGKEDITQYMYEPWHFRYVGIEAASVIFERDWTLEEFFNTVKEI